MQPMLFAVPTLRALTPAEAQTLCLAADDRKRTQYARHPDLPTAQCSLVSQALLRIAAARTLRVPAQQVQIAYTDRGKPFLPDTGWYCSVSHTDGLCVCALSDREVGVDVERIRPHTPRVAARVFSESEQIRLQNSDVPDQCFFEIWTKRESFVKCLGTGLSDISAEIPETARFHSFTWQEKFVISVCTFTDLS